jgi:hypothetical protein
VTWAQVTAASLPNDKVQPTYPQKPHPTLFPLVCLRQAKKLRNFKGAELQDFTLPDFRKSAHSHDTITAAGNPDMAPLLPDLACFRLWR